MPRNQKLTRVIKGRTVQHSTTGPGKLEIIFDDASTMSVKTTAIAAVPPGSKIEAVLEDGHECTVRFDNGTSVTLLLADPGASVAVRNRDGVVEYLG